MAFSCPGRLCEAFCVANLTRIFKIDAHHLSIFHKKYQQKGTNVQWTGIFEDIWGFLDITRGWPHLLVKYGPIKHTVTVSWT